MGKQITKTYRVLYPQEQETEVAATSLKKVWEKPDLCGLTDILWWKNVENQKVNDFLLGISIYYVGATSDQSTIVVSWTLKAQSESCKS